MLNDESINVTLSQPKSVKICDIKKLKQGEIISMFIYVKF